MSGLTVEQVNEMQDEMNKIGDEDPKGDDAKAAEAKAAEDVTKLAEAKVAEDAAKAKADADAKAKDGEGDKAKEEDVDVVRELKEQVRASNEALKKVTGDYQKLHKIMVDKGLITDEEVEATKAEEAAQKAVAAERQAKLTEMVTIMELNPNYGDVRQVCSQGNLDDVVDAFSRYYVKENGGDVQEIASKMEQEIWAEANPYKRIYELVKKYHPKFAPKDDEKSKEKEAEEAAKKIAAEADKAKDKKPVDTNPSAASIGAGGSGTGGGGWTAAKIDALSEDELHTVPKDIYDKYLKGTLS
jgi:uncharacterized membrane-anchored protein YhcB (DUF1043 family)